MICDRISMEECAILTALPRRVEPKLYGQGSQNDGVVAHVKCIESLIHRRGPHIRINVSLVTTPGQHLPCLERTLPLKAPIRAWWQWFCRRQSALLIVLFISLQRRIENSEEMKTGDGFDTVAVVGVNDIWCPIPTARIRQCSGQKPYRSPPG